MSISDLIVVMKDGSVQQIGAPQDVYDSPVNLFVAKFLGTPPINVFTGRVQGGRVMIGEEAIMDASGVCDQDVWVAIRPEGFELAENGPFSCDLIRVEVMGRDISVVASHPLCENTSIRAIIASKNKVAVGADKVRFQVAKDKVFLFNASTQERIFVD